MRTCRFFLTSRVVAMVFAGLELLVPRRAGAAATIVVNTTSYQDIDNNECSIYEAVIAANTNASYKGCAAVNAGVGDTITFNLSPFNRRINILITPLPAITEAVTIDGAIAGGERVELHGGGAPPVSGRHGITVTPTGYGTIIRNLVINNFADDGIFINADEVWVFGCRIGTDVTGTMAMPNQGFGIQVFGGNGNRIGSGLRTGSACDGDCNLISGATNSKANVLLDLNSLGALVRGNYIGTDVTGTVGITPQDVQGIVDKGGGNRIGGAAGTTPDGPCTGDCNLISGNNINGGIVLDEAAAFPVVLGNFVGTDVTGTASISNGIQPGYSEGILSYANYATIGGTTPAARNVVSGNVGTGIQVRGVGSVVRGNYVGTDPTGTVAVPNSGPGVTLDQSSGAVVGGIEAGAGNLLSGASTNGGNGVQAYYSTNAQIVGNRIGTAADGVTPLPNLRHGVLLHFESSNNIVGGASALAGNVIAYNGGYGVRVDATLPQVRSNTIRANRIHDNDDGGIELSAGANDNLAPPTILGRDPLHGISCAQCVVEIFSDGDGQGAVFEGAVFSSDGTWSYDGSPVGPNVTATNTNTSNNTSPFSAPFVLFSPTPTATPTATIPTATATAPPTPSRTASATRTPSATATSVATLSATAPASATPSASPTRTSSKTSTATATATSSPSATASPPGTAPPSPSPSRTSSATAIATPATLPPTATATAAPSASETPPPSPPPTASATAAQTAEATSKPPTCTGDCDGDGTVTIDELIRGVGIALGTAPTSDCPAFANGDGVLDIAQLVRGVGNALAGCPAA